MSTEHKRVRRLWLEINDKHLFQGLRVCQLKTQLGHTQSVPKKNEKLSSFLRRISPTFLAFGWVPDDNLPDVQLSE